VARELWEETGLEAKRINGAVGDPHLFSSPSGKQICRFNFVVQAETDAEGRLQPKLDPEEHQRFIWAIETEVKARKAKDMESEFTTQDLVATILQAFEQVKES
jgi:8-oxo-dGTP pyrophosphatase MutT (NUDIX family)